MPRIVEEVWSCGRCGNVQREVMTHTEIIDKSADANMPPGWCKLDMISNEGYHMGALDLCEACRSSYHEWATGAGTAEAYQIKVKVK